MIIINSLIFMFISFSTGIVISSAIFAFLTIIGLIPRLIIKTQTEKYIILYENVIIFSGFASALVYSLELNFSSYVILVWYLIFCLGIFTGSLAVCLTEVIDILPIVCRKFNLAKKTKILMIAIAIGKGSGAFIFYFFKLYLDF